jgi:predicted nucleic acid-binding protein
MSSIVIFDTSVLVDDLRTGCHQERIDSVGGIIRHSAVVIAELWRGVRSPMEREWLMEFEKNHTILTPGEKNWLESGRILEKMRKQCHLDSTKLRDLHFDVLIALTARSCGARLITSNRADFELIQRYRAFHLEVWPRTFQVV